VDYGEGAPTRVPGTERWRKPRLFVATLRYSRAAFAVRGLEVQPAGLGRAARAGLALLRWLPAVRGAGQPQGRRHQARPVRARAQPVYAATLAHYERGGRPGTGARPQPQGHGGARHRPHPGHGLKGRRFESIEEQNAFLEHWEKKWAASRIHGAERRQVQAMFEEERLTCSPCRCWACSTSPRSSARSATTAACGSTTAATPRARRPSAPRCWCASSSSASRSGSGTQALLRTHAGWSARHGGAAHGRAGVQPLSRDPPHPRQAGAIGEHASRLCEMLFAIEGRVGQRKLWGIVNLARRYPATSSMPPAHRPWSKASTATKHVKALTEAWWPRRWQPSRPRQAVRRPSARTR
jgi:hypothetical protein